MVKLSHNQQAWVAGNLAGLAAVGLVSIGLMYHGFGIELDNIEGQLAQFDADVDRLSRHVVALENDWLRENRKLALDMPEPKFGSRSIER